MTVILRNIIDNFRRRMGQDRAVNLYRSKSPYVRGGGENYADGIYRYQLFRETDTVKARIDIHAYECFMVAGGGGGGSDASGTGGYAGAGGGGGAGGALIVKEKEAEKLPKGEHIITIGEGGVGATLNNQGLDGEDTTLSDIYTAFGGGGGGGGNLGGRVGGSGGGAPYGQSGADGIDGQGYKGVGGSTTSGGAGGGASENALGKDGGDGRNIGFEFSEFMEDMLGENAWYGGGGGAGTNDRDNRGEGGRGGGGTGGAADGYAQAPAIPSNGMPNSGGGGGSAANRDDTSVEGADGGSGFAVFRYNIINLGVTLNEDNTADLEWMNPNNVEGFYIYYNGERQNEDLLTSLKYTMAGIGYTVFPNTEHEFHVIEEDDGVNGYQSNVQVVAPGIVNDFTTYAVDSIITSTSKWTRLNTDFGQFYARESTTIGASKDRYIAGPNGSQEIARWDELDIANDMHIRCRVRSSSIVSSSIIGICARLTTGGNYYSVELRQSGLRIVKATSGTRSLLDSNTSIIYEVDTWYWVDIKVEGTTIKAKGWVDGDVEPEYSLEVEDSDHGSGRTGLLSYTSSNFWDDLVVINYE